MSVSDRLRRTVALVFMAVGLVILSAHTAAIADVSTAPLGWLAESIEQRGLLIGLIAVFFGGMALNLTPCVYPLIPITLAFFGAQAAGRTARIIALAASYVVGLSLSYAILGVIAAKTGALLGSWLQQPAVLIAVAVLIAALACGMFGLYELRMPEALTRRFSRASGGLGGAFVMGVAVGVIAAPCIGPFVIGLFLFVSQLANVVTGFVIFLTLGLGMGTPYIALALAANRMSHLPRAGAWLVWSKHALGFVLLGLALYFLKPLLPEAIRGLVLAGLLLTSGVYLGWLAKTEGIRAGFSWVRHLTGAILVSFAVLLAWPRPAPVTPITWEPYSEAGFVQARGDQRPIIIDIYADWCLPCVELDHVTFRHPDVIHILASVATLRLDVTEDISKDGSKLIDRHRVFGVPTILLIDGDGIEHRELRITGFVRPNEFLKRLNQIL